MKANEFNMIRILALFMVINLWGCCRQSKEDKTQFGNESLLWEKDFIYR